MATRVRLGEPVPAALFFAMGDQDMFAGARQLRRLSEEWSPRLRGSVLFRHEF